MSRVLRLGMWFKASQSPPIVFLVNIDTLESTNVERDDKYSGLEPTLWKKVESYEKFSFPILTLFEFLFFDWSLLVVAVYEVSLNISFFKVERASFSNNYLST